MGQHPWLIGLVLRNKQDNEYRMLCPAPSMKEELVAGVCLVAQHLGHEPLAPGVLCPSGVSMASGSLVCTGLFLHPWEDGELPRSLLPGIFRCPAGLPFRLLLEHLGVAVSTCTAGSVTETQRLVSSCLEPYFSRKGDFRAPMTPASRQDSGEGGGSNRGIRNRTRCAFPPPVLAFTPTGHTAWTVLVSSPPAHIPPCLTA